MASPEITAAVCTLNRRESLLRALESVAAQDWEGGFEVLVVDNGSEDGTVEAVREIADRFPVPLRVEVEPARGVSRARNRALASARGRVVLFFDDDVVCRPGWLAAHGRAFRDPEVVATGGRILPVLPPETPKWFRETLPDQQGGPAARYDFGAEPAEIVRGGPVLPPFGANMALLRAAALEVGGFLIDVGWGRRKHLVHSEDIEITFRLFRGPGKVLYVPDSAVDHHIAAARTTRDYYRRWYQGLGRAWVIFQKPSPLRRVPLVLRALRGTVLWALREARLRRRGELSLSLHALGKRESYRGRLLELLGL